MSNGVAPIEDGNVSLSTLIRAIADDVEGVSSAGELTEYAPSEGRVAEVTTDGTVYVGDGQQWVAADSDLGLSTAVTNTRELSVTSAGGDLTTEVVDVITDTDASTTLDLDTGTISNVYDKYDIDLVVSNRSGGTDDDLRMRFNGVDTADYKAVEMAGATLNQKTALSYLSVGELKRYNFSAYEVTVCREVDSASSTGERLRCWGNGRGTSDYAVMQNGELSSPGTEEVTQIRAFTELDATGRMVVKGSKIT